MQQECHCYFIANPEEPSYEFLQLLDGCDGQVVLEAKNT